MSNQEKVFIEDATLGRGEVKQGTRKEYFVQDPPRLGNQYEEDTGLRAIIRRLIPPEFLEEIELDMIRFG